MISERSSVSNEIFRLFSISKQFHLKNDVRRGKKYVTLVTDGFMSPLVAHSDFNVEHDQTCVQCLVFEQIINRLRQNDIELIISGDNEVLSQTDWDLNARIAQLTGKNKHFALKSIQMYLCLFVLNSRWYFCTTETFGKVFIKIC